MTLYWPWFSSRRLFHWNLYPDAWFGALFDLKRRSTTACFILCVQPGSTHASSSSTYTIKLMPTSFHNHTHNNRKTDRDAWCGYIMMYSLYSLYSCLHWSTSFDGTGRDRDAKWRVIGIRWAIFVYADSHVICIVCSNSGIVAGGSDLEATVMFEYSSQQEPELSLRVGDVIKDVMEVSYRLTYL